MVLGLRDDDIVDERARYRDVARVEDAASKYALDLHDDRAAVVVDGGRHRGLLAADCFLFQRDVAVFVRVAAADYARVETERLVMQILRPVYVDERHDLAPGFPRELVDLAAFEARVAECMKPYFCDNARLARRNRAEKVSVDAERHGVARDLVRADGAADCGRHADVRGVYRRDEAGGFYYAEAPAVLSEVARGYAAYGAEVFRSSVSRVRLRHLAQNVVRRGAASEPADAYHRIISN